MDRWIFKSIYGPIFLIVTFCLSAVLTVILQDVGWKEPFTWMCAIGLLAYFGEICWKKYKGAK